MATMRDVFTELVDKTLKVVNPQSYVESIMKEDLRMESYDAKVIEVGDDFIRLYFQASKKKELTEVDQVIPFHEVKRISRWGDQRILHL